jgi:hypothetical protein
VARDPRDEPELYTPAPAAPNGQRSANGTTAAADPAHGGPLPQATLPELVGRLINDVSDLADRQIELAKQEIGEAKDEAIKSVVAIAIGAAIAIAAAMLLVIWAWTAFIWFFNWLGAFLTVGPVTFAWLGWVMGLIVPALAAFIAYKRFISGGIRRAKGIIPPLPRTRATLKEDLEWLQRQRTRSGR